jgi:dienelactone hydrolase
MITLKSFDGDEFDAYIALPAGGYGPGIVVLQEIFGVNAYMRQVADWYAAHGFVAIVPDLFWRQEPGIQLTDQTKAEWEKAFELYKGLDEAKAVERRAWLIGIEVDRHGRRRPRLRAHAATAPALRPEFHQRLKSFVIRGFHRSTDLRYQLPS